MRSTRRYALAAFTMAVLVLQNQAGAEESNSTSTSTAIGIGSGGGGGGGSGINDSSHLNPHLVKGIELYKAGNYRECIGQFGMALNSEFDNAILHYYMANAFVNMNQRETAIREFRIAYALAPTRDAGVLSKRALTYMHADNYDDGVKKIAKHKGNDKFKEPPVDPVFEKTLQMLKKQADDIGTESKLMTPKEQEATRMIDDTINKSKAAAVEAILKANPDDLHLPPEAYHHLNRVKLLNEEKMRRAGHAVRKSGAIKDSADSLQTLLSEKDSKTAPKLVPQGTNLYIRNYKAPVPKKNQQ